MFLHARNWIAPVVLLACLPALGIPHFNPEIIPSDADYGDLVTEKTLAPASFQSFEKEELKVLRIQVDWTSVGELYILKNLITEESGTPALYARAKNRPPWGSYIGVLKSQRTQKDLYFDSVGTGKEFRKLTRAMSFRFPVPREPVFFEVWAENPDTGISEIVLSKKIEEKNFKPLEKPPSDPEVKCLKAPLRDPSGLRLNIYSEGYLTNEASRFWVHAQKTVDVLVQNKFPGIENLRICAVFVPSLTKVGKAENLGWPVPETETFMGLFFPYWNNFGRWYHVVYPTREKRFRDAAALLPYDYVLALVNDSEYWGVGNYMELTAIPAENKNFTYLLLHEIGHFFGLNEEYEGGGRTELEFAPEIVEPWSQNMTFLATKSWAALKWNEFVPQNFPIPTPDILWKDNPPAYGTYLGGYADSAPHGKNHKPGHNCVMNTGKKFCQICDRGIRAVLKFGMGEPQPLLSLENKFHSHDH